MRKGEYCNIRFVLFVVVVCFCFLPERRKHIDLKHAASWKVQICLNRIGGVMVIVLAFSAVDRWVQPRLGQTKDCKIDIYFVDSPLTTWH